MTKQGDKFAGLKIPQSAADVPVPAKLRESVDALSRAGAAVRPTLDAIKKLGGLGERMKLAIGAPGGVRLESIDKLQQALAPSADALKGFRHLSEQMKRTAEAFGPDSSWGKLSRQIADQQKSIADMRATFPKLEIQERVHVPELRIPPNPIHETNKRLASIETRFDRMETIALNGAEIATSLQASAATFLSKFEAAAKDNDKTAARAIRVGVIAIVIAVATPMLQGLYTEVWRAPADAATMQVAISDMKQEIGGLQAVQREAAEKLSVVLSANGSDTTKALKEIRDLLANQRGQEDTSGSVDE